jgi:hypothetical protein
MRNVMRMVAPAVMAFTIAGCTATSDREPSVARPSTTTGPAATLTSTPTSTPTATPHQSAPSPRRLLLTRQGLGGVPVGATLDEFATALGRTATPMSATDRSVFADHSCVVRRLAGLRGVGLMVIGEDPDGQVRRISIVAGSDIRTDTGIGMGSSLDAVRTAYGPGLDEPFDHFPVGGDAVLVRAGANLYLAFIGDERDQVVELRLGFKPEVLDPEGCV